MAKQFHDVMRLARLLPFFDDQCLQPLLHTLLTVITCSKDIERHSAVLQDRFHLYSPVDYAGGGVLQDEQVKVAFLFALPMRP